MVETLKKGFQNALNYCNKICAGLFRLPVFYDILNLILFKSKHNKVLEVKIEFKVSILVDKCLYAVLFSSTMTMMMMMKLMLLFSMTIPKTELKLNLLCRFGHNAHLTCSTAHSA